MGQAEDRLLDVSLRIRKACISLSGAADDSDWPQYDRDLMAAKADGLAMALSIVEEELGEKKERRVF